MSGKCTTLLAPRVGEHGYVLGMKIDNASGTVWVATDTQSGASLREYNIQTSQMERTARLEGKYVFNDLLYVSAWGDGIAFIDLQTGSVEPLPHPDQVCLSFIDGLYSIGGSLVAIQNGPMLPRIVRFNLDARGKRVVGMTVLERRNPLFGGITTGVTVSKELYYLANPQTDKADVKPPPKLDPLEVLAVKVVR